MVPGTSLQRACTGLDATRLLFDCFSRKRIPASKIMDDQHFHLCLLHVVLRSIGSFDRAPLSPKMGSPIYSLLCIASDLKRAKPHPHHATKVGLSLSGSPMK